MVNLAWKQIQIYSRLVMVYLTGILLDMVVSQDPKEKQDSKDSKVLKDFKEFRAFKE